MEFRNAEISLRMIAPGGTVHLTGSALIESCPFFSTTHFLMVRIFLYTCDISGRGEGLGRRRETLKGNLSRGLWPRPSNPADRVKYKNRSFRLLVQDKRDHFMTVMIHFVFQQDGFFFSQNYAIWLFRKKHLWYHKFRPFIVTLLSKKTPFPRR